VTGPQNKIFIKNQLTLLYTVSAFILNFFLSLSIFVICATHTIMFRGRILLKTRTLFMLNSLLINSIFLFCLCLFLRFLPRTCHAAEHAIFSVQFYTDHCLKC
jgi:hypothetical protein